jgi:hypothetical protein
MRVPQLNRKLDAPGVENAPVSTVEFLKTFDRRMAVPSNLDQVAIRIPHVTAHFPAVIVERLCQNPLPPRMPT